MVDATRVDEIVSRPYAKLLVRDEESGGYYAEVLEVPSCFSEGDTPDEAIEALDDAFRLTVESALEDGDHIPEPLDAGSHSGKLVVRMPSSTHRDAAYRAQAEGTSLNQWLLASVTRNLGTQANSERSAADLHLVLARLNDVVERLEELERAVEAIDSRPWTVFEGVEETAVTETKTIRQVLLTQGAKESRPEWGRGTIQLNPGQRAGIYSAIKLKIEAARELERSKRQNG